MPASAFLSISITVNWRNLRVNCIDRAGKASPVSTLIQDEKLLYIEKYYQKLNSDITS